MTPFECEDARRAPSTSSLDRSTVDSLSLSPCQACLGFIPCVCAGSASLVERWPDGSSRAPRRAPPRYDRDVTSRRLTGAERRGDREVTSRRLTGAERRGDRGASPVRHSGPTLRSPRPVEPGPVKPLIPRGRIELTSRSPRRSAPVRRRLVTSRSPRRSAPVRRRLVTSRSPRRSAPVRRAGLTPRSLPTAPRSRLTLLPLRAPHPSPGQLHQRAQQRLAPRSLRVEIHHQVILRPARRDVQQVRPRGLRWFR